MNTRATAADTVPALVLHRIGDDDGQIFDVEIGGTVFNRAQDQEERRRQVRLDAIGAELIALVPDDQRKHASRLLGEFEQLWGGRVTDVSDHTLRTVGYALTDQALRDQPQDLHKLWLMLFARLGPNDDRGRPAEAYAFLHGEGVDTERGGHW
jgi:hypothetical protein